MGQIGQIYGSDDFIGEIYGQVGQIYGSPCGCQVTSGLVHQRKTGPEVNRLQHLQSKWYTESPSS